MQHGGRLGCELLSFNVSLLFENSMLVEPFRRTFVVNCFHLTYLCSLKTAAAAVGVMGFLL